MGRKRIYVSICVVGVLLVLNLGAGMARDSEEEEQSQDLTIINDEINPRFSYQGMLRESGTPVTGFRDMVFHLFSDATCSTTVGGHISMPGVVVNEGVFSVELSITSSNFNGQARWLGVQVEGVTIGCQEILPVPYAFSLRPGARIEGERGNWDALHVINTANSGDSYGVLARSFSPYGRGVYGYASAASGSSYGVYGRSNSSDGTGVYARGIDEGADLILAGNANTTHGDDGRITSDPNYASSDIYLITNDGIRIELDRDGNGEDADFEIRNNDNELIFNVDESGAVTSGGPGVAAFPRPAYDSGYRSPGLGGTLDLSHDLGGNVDNYVVDLTCQRSGGAGVNNWGVGGDVNSGEVYGAWWRDLSTSTITIRRGSDDTDCPNVRVRIWMYQ